VRLVVLCMECVSGGQGGDAVCSSEVQDSGLPLDHLSSGPHLRRSATLAIRAAARCIRVSALASALSRSSWRSCSRGSRLVNRGQAGRPGKRSWIPMADSMRSATPALARRIAVQILGWSKLWIARSGDPWPDRALVSTTDECALDAEGRPRFRLLTTRDPDLSVNT
jgi:hypothetical protein